MGCIVGITGGIGAGKSVVSRILRCQGYDVYDCDSEARRLMDGCEPLAAAIAGRLGSECVYGDGTLNRVKIAEVVFNDAAKLAWLNSEVHAMVRADICSRNDRLLFVESAILASSGLAAMCDEIWLVDAPQELRLQRAMQRDGCNAAKILERMRAQQREIDLLPQERLHVIVNDGTTPLLDRILQSAKRIC